MGIHMNFHPNSVTFQSVYFNKDSVVTQHRTKYVEKQSVFFFNQLTV